MHAQLNTVTERIIQRSQKTRRAYLAHIEQQMLNHPVREALSCSNQAHTYAAAPEQEKLIFKQNHRAANMAIVSAYNDMLSAHAPYYRYPEKLKAAVAEVGHLAQMAGGVPAMCDGITQGQLGMELSLFSRDTIALSTAVALSHHVFDGMMLLGICDKIVPGLLMAALRFGHLPAIFVPAGPMGTGISNSEKAAVRREYAKGKVDKNALLDSEMKAYHEPGTCTFYGTANSNQMLVEIMGLQLPGGSFIHPKHPMRDALTRYAAQRLCKFTALEPDFMPLGKMLDERSFANAIVGLLATGGSTNHTLHLLAMAKMAGIQLDWQDIDDLSKVVPLLARIYPNGEADVNGFHQAGDMPFLIRQLLSLGLLHDDVNTVMGKGLEAYTLSPSMNEAGQLEWHPSPQDSSDYSTLRPANEPFSKEGGLKLLTGNLGRSVMKTSAVPEDHWLIEAPVRVFYQQQQVLDAYKNNELNQDVIVVLLGQGPAANGMPELHQLIPSLSNLQLAGYKVALITDGRLSGASGTVPAAIHICPEAAHLGPVSKLKDGDRVRLDAVNGSLNALVEDFEQRATQPVPKVSSLGLGRELFSLFRHRVTQADAGAISIDWSEDEI